MATFKSKGFGVPPQLEDASPNLDEPETFEAGAAPKEPEQPAAEQGAPHAHVPLPRRREPTQPMNLRVPFSLFDELRQFMRDTDIPMTEVAVAGIRKELAALKKKYGLK